MSLGKLTKDPHASLKYTVDWSDWLAAGDTIASVVWTLATGITNAAVAATTTTATITVSGGTAGTDYTVACKVTTTLGEIDERTFTLRVRDR